MPEFGRELTLPWEGDMRPPLPTTGQTISGQPLPGSQPVPGGPVGPSAPGQGPMPIPGFGGSQDVMRQIMMQILLPQLQRFFGGQQPGWGPVAGSQTRGMPNPYPTGMPIPAQGGPGPRTPQPIPSPVQAGQGPGVGFGNPAQTGQGPAGMMQGDMSWLAPFIMQQFFQNMPGFGGGGSFGQGQLPIMRTGGGPNRMPANPDPNMAYLT